MLEYRSDYENMRASLQSIGYSGEDPESYKILDAVVAACLTIAEFDLSEEALKTVLSLIQSDSRLAISAWMRAKEGMLWEDFNYGNTTFGDYVRVKVDAYDSVSGTPHNGLVGILTQMSQGKCLVEYLGLAAGQSMYHPMENLESLKVV